MPHTHHTPDGQLVAQEIQQIQAALQQAGFRTRKQPRQPLWTITAPDAPGYRLSFQPAPIRGWVLHPLDEHPVRRRIMEIVQSVVLPERVSWRQQSMARDADASGFSDNYRPWMIVLIRNAVQRSTIARFRNRQDADDYLRAIRRFLPRSAFEVVFDPPEQTPHIHQG